MQVRTTKRFGVALALGAMLCAGCGDRAAEEASPGSGGSPRVDPARSGARPGYPALYREHALPEYPEAALVDVGRQATSLRDGLRLTLRTDHPPAEAAGFYEEQLTRAGWAAPPNRFPNDQLILREFTKDELVYRFTIRSEAEGGAQIDVTFMQR